MTEMTELSPEAQWCRNLFNSLTEGGVWGIPRSGLMFRKQDGKLVLYERMPWMAEMDGVISEFGLRLQQDRELDDNRRYFGEAGIEIIDETKEEPWEK